MAKQNINAGSAPIVWSTVKDAFEKINANFTEIYSTLGEELSPVDFTRLETSVIPNQNDQYDLGSVNNRWQQLFLTSEGILIGNASLRSIGSTLQLPVGSRVGSKLINDPADVGFGTVKVSGQDDVVADDVTASLNIAQGNGITITTDAVSDTVTIANTGVLDVASGSGISVSGGSTKTITNTGVTAVLAGLGVSVDNSTGPVIVTNDGIVGLEAGTGITIGARSSETGRVVITNSAPATGILVFRDILVAGQDTLAAQSVADQLAFVAGDGILLTTAPAGGGFPSRISVSNSGVRQILTSGPGISVSGSTGTVTLSFDNRVDIVGSVFSDNSVMLVDGTNGIIPAEVIQGTFTGTVVGNVTGNVNGDVTGNITGNVNGNLTGTTTGTHIGDVKGTVVGDDSTILVDAVDGKIVGPIESVTATLGKIKETVVNINNATGTVEHNCVSSHTFHHRSIASDFGINLTSLTLENNQVTEITVILDQGVTGYSPTTFAIDSVSLAIKWVDNVIFSATANNVDVLTYTISRYNNDYTVLTSYKTFGIGV
jgi:hypothetical protein